MENGVLKGLLWLAITNNLNARTGKNFLTKQVIQKHNRFQQKQCKWTQLQKHTGLGWDEITQTITCVEEVWANVVTVCLLVIHILTCFIAFNFELSLW